MERLEPEPRPERPRANRLRLEKSPYLLQHAENPVDWYPWGDEAFAVARLEDKPVFLSIGYSTCHWCHVMAHESFEDPTVAALMNEAFVNIKVDREERPDIDDVYMTVAQVMSSRGGWPLTILMTPDKVPFFAGTYIPRTDRFGMAGMLTLIPSVKEAWRNRRGQLLDVGSQVVQALQQMGRGEKGEDLTQETLDMAFRQLSQRYDAEEGGFGPAPKFPTPHNLTFLLRSWKRTGEASALQMVEQTLQAMRRGGIYDQLGFGFHRYSTDAQWLVPHFEKMLYDQALLTLAYTEAYQATANPVYRQTVEEVLTYVLRDMTSPESGFYSAEDADSEGQEGKFYLWTQAELLQVLGQEEGELVCQVFGVRLEGNFHDEASRAKTGHNILHLAEPLAVAAENLRMAEPDLVRRLETARARLFAFREGRAHPHKDDKVLPDWNGLMIAALAKAAQALEAPAYAHAAARAAEFILQRLVGPDGRLLHRFRDGEAAVPAYAADYAFLIWGLLELYEATFEVCYLERALALNAELLSHFWDRDKGGLFSTADDGERLLVRQKDLYDGAIPSANSVAMHCLLRLGRLTGAAVLEEKAAAIQRAFSSSISQSPLAYTQFLVAVDSALGPSHEVVIAGDPEAADTQAILQALRTRFLPNQVVLLRPERDPAGIARLAPFTEFETSLYGKATAYVCHNYRCEYPTTDVQAMLKLLGCS